MVSLSYFVVVSHTTGLHPVNAYTIWNLLWFVWLETECDIYCQPLNIFSLDMEGYIYQFTNTSFYIQGNDILITYSGIKMGILQFLQKTTDVDITLTYILYFTTKYVTRLAYLIYIMPEKKQ